MDDELSRITSALSQAEVRVDDNTSANLGNSCRNKEVFHARDV
jgi:hypothetical protein